jgi:hypothetical protein
MTDGLGHGTVDIISTYHIAEEITRNIQEIIINHAYRMGKVKEGQNEVTSQQNE